MKRILPLLTLCTALLAVISCKKPVPVAVTDIKVEPGTLSLEVEETGVLAVTISPENAENKDFTVTSSKPSVASAEKTGDAQIKVTALKEGNATITVKSADGGKTATCSVTVAAKVIPVDRIWFDFEEDEFAASMIGHIFQLPINFSPENATNLNTLTATSSNPDVVEVTEEGLLVVGPGSTVITLSNADGSVSASCTITVPTPVIEWVKMEYEKLPDMTIPRSDMAIFYSGDELVVAGGHTNGFRTTDNAGYLKDGNWTEMTMTARHDNQATVILENGKVAILGGTGNGGSGTYANVDLYDPENHSFSALPAMKTSRGLFHGTAIGNDIVVSGNWYSSDNIERYSAADNEFTVIKGVSSNRSNPYVLRSADNNAIVFGAWDTRGSTSSAACVVDQLDGESFIPDLFEEWKPMYVPTSFKSTDCQIGDYKYLIGLENTQTDFTYGLCLVDGNEFSLVKTFVRIPHRDPDGNGIYYNGIILVDQSKQVGYMIACDRNRTEKYYVLKIDYAQVLTRGTANLTIYYSDPIDDIAAGQSGYALMPDGRVMVAGGIYNSNSTTYQTMYAFGPY